MSFFFEDHMCSFIIQISNPEEVDSQNQTDKSKFVDRVVVNLFSEFESRIEHFSIN